MNKQALSEAMSVHTSHIVANGEQGHTARDEWRNCRHETCVKGRALIEGKPMKLRVTKDGDK